MYRPRPFDIAALLLSVACIVIIAVVSYGEPVEAKQIHIHSYTGDWYYPLDSEENLSVPGPLGTTEVVIKDGTVRIEASPCRGKNCITMGAVSKPGAWIACLPNRVFIRITGETEEGTDAGTY